MYKDSWIFKYYNYDVKVENGTVFFFDSRKNTTPNKNNFQIYIYTPRTSQSYFLPKSQWKKISPTNNLNLETELISKIPHGTRAKAFPSSKSIFYHSPFFIVFKNPGSMSNFLTFNNFFHSNSPMCVLALVLYEEEQNNFIPYFAPGIKLSSLKSLCLDKTLEFILIDSHQQIVSVDPDSQLFIQISIDE